MVYGGKIVYYIQADFPIRSPIKWATPVICIW
jgi:hypothetical protein